MTGCAAIRDARGRRATPEATPPARRSSGVSLGSRNGNARLDEAAVRRLRVDASNGATSRVLARRYGVSIWTVYQIVQRKTWRHV